MSVFYLQLTVDEVDVCDGVVDAGDGEVVEVVLHPTVLLPPLLAASQGQIGVRTPFSDDAMRWLALTMRWLALALTISGV